MKNLILIHGITTKEICAKIEPVNEIGRNKWLKKICINRGYKVANPLVPNLWEADYNSWKKTFEKEDFNKSTTVVAQSAGAAFIVRFLGETDLKIKKLILVAPAKIPNEANMYLEKFYNYEISDNIKNNIEKTIILAGAKDEQRHLDAAEIYAEKLNAELKVFSNRGHFMSEELEEILEYID